MDTQIIPIPTNLSAKALYDKAKESLSTWETDINKHTVALDKLNSGDKHSSVYEALRDVVMFACWCMDNPKEAKSAFKEWPDHEPARATTNPYQQPVNLIFDRAGVTLESITCKRCEWAAIARYLQPMVKAGTVDESNLISFIEAKGGIRSTYDSIPKDGGKGRPKGGSGKGGMSGADADKTFQANFNKLKQPRYVVAVFDISKSNAHKTADSLGNFLSRMDGFICAREGSADDLADDEAAQEDSANDLNIFDEGLEDEAA